MKKLFYCVFVLIILISTNFVTAYTDYEAEMPPITISGAMSFDDLIQHYAAAAGMAMEISDILPIDDSSSIGFRVLSVPLMAETGYVPRLEFYCRTEEAAAHGA